jgi:uncharacterized alkaline shock family protein YloU
VDSPVRTTSPVRLHVTEAAVASIAAATALRVPGVVGLRPDLARALLGLAGSMLGHTHAASDGVDATVTGDAATGQEAEVTVTLATRLGHNCRDLAAAVQEGVALVVAEQTGLAVRVTVTVADVELD